VSKLRYDDSDRFFERIQKKEGIANQVGLAYPTELANWHGFFKSFQKSGKNIIVENENPEEELFIIGKIQKVNKTSVTILGFDAKARWHKEPTKISYSEITCVSFDSRYIKIFSKYLK